jgi:hypothetical protein
MAVKIRKFSDAFAFYSNLVHEEDRQAFLDAVAPGMIVRNTEDKKTYSVPYRRLFESGIRHYRVEFARLDLGDKQSRIVAGFRDVEEEFLKDQAESTEYTLESYRSRSTGSKIKTILAMVFNDQL